MGERGAGTCKLPVGCTAVFTETASQVSDSEPRTAETSVRFSEGAKRPLRSTAVRSLGRKASPFLNRDCGGKSFIRTCPSTLSIPGWAREEDANEPAQTVQGRATGATVPSTPADDRYHGARMASRVKEAEAEIPA